MSVQQPVTKAQLEAILRDPNTTEETLRTILVEDTDRREPFEVTLKSAPGVTFDVKVEEFGPALDLINKWVRLRRKMRYQQMIAADPNRKRLVAEGDSWFQHPLIKETIDHLVNLYGHPVRSLDAAGDTLQEIRDQNEYLATIQSEKASALLLSGGGNDLMGGRFGDWLLSYTPGAPGANPERLINEAALGAEMTKVEGLYDHIVGTVEAGAPGVLVFVHTYDYAIPRTSGNWLGKPLIAKGITHPLDHQAVIKLLIDRFQDLLKGLAAAHPSVRLVDNRTLVPAGGWYDEIHPSDAGFVPVAANFQSALVNAGIV